MNISVEEAKLVAWGDSDKFEDITSDKITGQGRWDVYKEKVVKNKENGKFYFIEWSQGATESQDTGPFEYETGNIVLVECEEVEVTKIEWKPIKKGDS